MYTKHWLVIITTGNDYYLYQVEKAGEKSLNT